MQKMYKGLENKIISLQQRIDELNKANNQLKQKTVEIPELKQQLQKKKALEAELKSLRVLLIDNEESMVLLAKQVETERNERIAILNAKTKADEQLKADKETLNKENLKLQTKIIEMVENAKAEENSTYSFLFLIVSMFVSNLNPSNYSTYSLPSSSFQYLLDATACSQRWTMTKFTCPTRKSSRKKSSWRRRITC